MKFLSLTSTLGAFAVLGLIGSTTVRTRDYQGSTIFGANPSQIPSRDATRTPERTTTGSITGRVRSADVGQPLRGAQISISGATFRRLVATDEMGRYRVDGLAPGRYTLVASKTGFVTLAYGQRRSGESGRPLEVAQNQELANVDFALPKGAVLVTRVTDEFSDPVVHVFISAYQYRFLGGSRTLVEVPQAMVETDDQGVARIGGLVPGKYVIGGRIHNDQPLAASGSERVYLETFFPGTSVRTEAQTVSVGVGQEVEVSFSLVAARTVRVAGMVVGPNGASTRAASVLLDDRTSRIMPDGSFGFDGIAPGEHIALVKAGGRDDITEFSSTKLNVGTENIVGLILVTGQPSRITGRFEFDGGRPPGDLLPTALRISTIEAPGARSGITERLEIHDDWTFQISNIVNQRAFKLSSNGWFIKSITVDGRDATDSSVDFAIGRLSSVIITITNKVSRIVGTVSLNDGKRVNEYAVIAFPDEPSRRTWHTQRIATARPDQNGQFRIMGLPPGHYYLAAVDYLEVGQERDPELLTKLEGSATTISVSEGQEITADLRLAEIP